MPISVTCLHCGKEFAYSPSKKRRYCSMACYDSAREFTKTVTCLTCGKVFSDQKHPNRKYCSLKCSNLAQQDKVTITCASCGKPFTVKSSHAWRRHCSSLCRHGYDIYANKAEKGHKRETRTCKHCGAAFETWAYRTTQHCSRKCANASKLVTGAKVECRCEECGKSYKVGRFFVEKRRSRYCSSDCQHAAFSHQRRGASNVNYRGGSVQYRGRNWRRQSRLARKRDGYRCQICCTKIGKKPRDHGVHHIKPYRDFDGDWLSANDLSNLITLCVSCHSSVEFGNLACPRPLF